MNATFKRVLNIAKECLDEICPLGQTPTQENFLKAAKTAVATIRTMEKDVTLSDHDLLRQLQADYTHSMPAWQILDEDPSASKHKEWLQEAKSEIDWQYWDRCASDRIMRLKS